jgi:hypothetical protein
MSCSIYTKNYSCAYSSPVQLIDTGKQSFDQKQKIVTQRFALTEDVDFYQTRDGCWQDNCDPRVWDQVRGMYVPISRPPYTSGIDPDLASISGKDSLKSLRRYDNLADINVGNRIYYYSNELAQPHNPNNFSIPADTHKTLFVDPMTSPKPLYFREKLVYGSGIDQYTRDQTAFREDLTERLLRKDNQTNWQIYHNRN